MLTSFADDDALFDAIMAGASGYVLKQIRGADLVGAVRRSPVDSPCWTRGRRHRCSSGFGRQRRGGSGRDAVRAGAAVLALIGEGLTNREIGERMFLAEKTVKNYVSHLLAKLGMQRRTQAAILATELRRAGDLEP